MVEKGRFMSRITKQGEYLWFDGKKIKISSIINYNSIRNSFDGTPPYSYSLEVHYKGFLGFIKTLELDGLNEFTLYMYLDKLDKIKGTANEN
jgi:hypothetical protein